MTFRALDRGTGSISVERIKTGGGVFTIYPTDVHWRILVLLQKDAIRIEPPITCSEVIENRPLALIRLDPALKKSVSFSYDKDI